jgi:hypothetical protein
MHEGASSHRRSRWMSVGLGLALVAALLPGATARAQSPDVVVSQVYGGGGNSGATYRNDFIELFNRGGHAGGRHELVGAVRVGRRFHVAEDGYLGDDPCRRLLPRPGGGGSRRHSRPPHSRRHRHHPDERDLGEAGARYEPGTSPCGATAGTCLPNPAIRDFVGYGSADNFEGTGPTPTLTNTTAALRGNGGCTNTDDNTSDFATGAPNPRNSAAPLNPCPTDPSVTLDCGDALLTWAGRATTRTLTASDPNGTVTDFAITDITPSPAPGAITLSNETPATAPGETATADVDVDASVPVGSYSVQVTASNDDVPSQSGACTLTVEVFPEPTPIYEIQGPTHESPLVGTEVATTGVVTVVVGNGFFIQDLEGDGDGATSDGIFAFGSDSARRVAPGDVVLVEGTVAEFRPASRPRDLTLTELSNISTAVIDEADLPTPEAIVDRPTKRSIPTASRPSNAWRACTSRSTTPRSSDRRTRSVSSSRSHPATRAALPPAATSS